MIMMDPATFAVAIALGVALGLGLHAFLLMLIRAFPSLLRSTFPNWGKRRRTYTPEAIHGRFDPAPFEGPVRKLGFILPLVWIYPTRTIASGQRWSIYLGGDEYDRRTLVLPIPFVGQVVIALWRGGVDEDRKWA